MSYFRAKYFTVCKKLMCSLYSFSDESHCHPGARRWVTGGLGCSAAALRPPDLPRLTPQSSPPVQYLLFVSVPPVGHLPLTHTHTPNVASDLVEDYQMMGHSWKKSRWRSVVQSWVVSLETAREIVGFRVMVKGIKFSIVSERDFGKWIQMCSWFYLSTLMT